MARRGGRKGTWLATDDYTGLTCYASELRKDYWGAMTKKPLLRNLQEICSPLGDPYPVEFFRGSTYEVVNVCSLETIPVKIGLTNINTKSSLASQVMGWEPSIGNMSVGCTFTVF